jgi:hypothetical protein
LVVPPIAVVTSVVGLIRDKTKTEAIAGLIVGLLTAALGLIPIFCAF